MENMLSKARYIDEEEIMACENEKDRNKKNNGYLFAIKKVSCKDRIQVFQEDLYKKRLHDIGINLNTMKKQEGLIDKIFKYIWHPFYDYLFKHGFL